MQTENNRTGWTEYRTRHVCQVIPQCLLNAFTFYFYFHLVYFIGFFHYFSFIYFYFGVMAISKTHGFQIRDLGS